MPGQWSTVAPDIDWLYYFIYWMSVVLFVAIIGAALYFVWKYDRSKHPVSEPTGHNLPLEVGWTVAPLFFLVLLFHWGFKGYTDLTVAPANAIDIRVRAKKWSWDFEYPNGAHNVTANTLHVPVNRPVRLVMSSDDVLHAFFVPNFRVKRDAVPGMYSTLWFQATTTGTADFFCAEYCGAAETGSRDERGNESWAGHFSMIGKVVIESEPEWLRHLDEFNGPPMIDGRPATPAQWGARLYRSSQCYTCHSIDGSPMTGPTWRGLFNHAVPLADGTTVTADENYLRSSILNPQQQIVRGFQPVMPTYRGSLNDRQLDALIEYIKTLH
jgi:cytochrome c oxidase subunit 2